MKKGSKCMKAFSNIPCTDSMVVYKSRTENHESWDLALAVSLTCFVMCSGLVRGHGCKGRVLGRLAW